MPMYDSAMVQPMRDELTQAGVRELFTREDVRNVLNDESKTTLLFVNSVCGCAARQARPGLTNSLDNPILPDNICTVFAGMETEAVDEARSYFLGYPPSSPCLAVFREGELVHFLQRSDFLNRSAEALSTILKSVYTKYCGKEVNESVEIVGGNLDAQLQIKPEEVKKLMDDKVPFTLLDVRKPYELDVAVLPNTKLLDDNSIDDVLALPRNTKLIFICHHGNKSLQAARYFKTQGFEDSHSIDGGIEAWSNKVDSSVPLY